MTDRQRIIASKSTGLHDVKLKDRVSCAPFEQLLNIRIIEAENAKATLAMPFYHENKRPVRGFHSTFKIARHRQIKHNL